MKWILVIMLYHYPTGGSRNIESMEFNSQEACEYGLIDLQNANLAGGDSWRIDGICIFKGERSKERVGQVLN